MPDYTVRDPKSGRTLTLRGDSPPTEQELEEVFAASTPMASHDTDPAAGSWNQDFLGGARAGLAQTVVGVTDLARRGVNLLGRTTFPGTSDVLPNSPYENPTAKALMDPPPTWAGTIGHTVERGAEFAVPLTKVARAAAPLNVFSRMAANATAGGGVAALQTGGDPVSTFMGAAGGAILPPVSAGMQAIGGGAKRAAAGAAEGGVGGALASIVRSAAPDDPKDMFMRGVKPRATLTKWDASVDRALPEIKSAEAQLGRPIGGVDDALEATKLAKKTIQRQLGKMRGSLTAINAEVDLSSVADAAIEAIPKKVTLLQPDEAAKLAASVDNYRKAYSLEDVETFLRETNAELDAFYAQYPGAQRARLTANPDVAMKEAQARALRAARDELFNRLDSTGAGGQAAKELNQRYGALLDVEGELYRRVNVAKRQQPESLSEQIGAVRAAGQVARGLWRMRGGHVVEGGADIAGGFAGRATAKAIKENQTTDALIRRAFENYTTAPTAVPMPAPRRAAGLLGPGPVVTPPPADASFVRSVPAIRSHAYREGRALPPGRPAIPMGSAADKSAVDAVPAAPLEHRIDPTVPASPRGYGVAQYSGDVHARAVPVVSDKVRPVLERMLEDLDTFTPQRGRLVRDARGESVYAHGGPGSPVGDDIRVISEQNVSNNEIRQAIRDLLDGKTPTVRDARGESVYAHGGPGSPVGDDIRVISEQNVSNNEIRQAIRDLLDGKTPTNRLHTAALDAAEGYLERRPGYRGPTLPAKDDGFEAFSRAVDELADEP